MLACSILYIVTHLLGWLVLELIAPPELRTLMPVWLLLPPLALGGALVYEYSDDFTPPGQPTPLRLKIAAVGLAIAAVAAVILVASSVSPAAATLVAVAAATALATAYARQEVTNLGKLGLASRLVLGGALGVAASMGPLAVDPERSP